MTASAVVMTRLGLAALYFSRFLLTAVPAQLYLAALFLCRPRAPRPLVWYAVTCGAFVVTTVVLGRSLVPLRNAAFYFSFLTPLLAMCAVRRGAARFTAQNGFVIAVCVATLVEALLINTPLGADVWFFPADHPHRNLIFGAGWYQRPSGLTGIASSTAFIVVFSLILADVFDRNWRLLSARNVLATVTLTVLAAGTGFVLFILYLITKVPIRALAGKRPHLVSRLSVIAVVLILLYGATGNLWTNELNKFSFTYVWLIIENKMAMIRELHVPAVQQLLLGGQVSRAAPVLNTASDFGYFGMFHAMGLIGCALVLSAPLVFFRAIPSLAVPTAFVYLSFVHYPSLSSPPGAVLFAFYLFMLHDHTVASRRAVVEPAAALPATA